MTLRSQLDEAQSRLQRAEDRLHYHEEDAKQMMEEWRSRLEESEQRMKKQQAEKDDQMKTIINRCGQNPGWALVGGVKCSIMVGGGVGVEGGEETADREGRPDENYHQQVRSEPGVGFT